MWWRRRRGRWTSPCKLSLSCRLSRRTACWRGNRFHVRRSTTGRWRICDLRFYTQLPCQASHTSFLSRLLRPRGTRRFGQKKTRRLVPFPAEALAQAGWTEHETTCQRHVAATLSNHFKCARFSAVEVRLGIRDFSPRPLTLRIIPKNRRLWASLLKNPQRRASGTPSLIRYTNKPLPCDKNAPLTPK